MTSGAGTAARGLAVYGAVLARRATVGTFAASLLARLPISMAPLGIVLLVERTSGSYAAAGLVTAAFAAGTAGGAPVWGRAMDTRAQHRVLVPVVTSSACLIVALALVAQAGGSVPLLCALALGAGLTFPPFSAAMRSSWRVLLPDLVQRRAGYALDAAAVESIFVMGPLLLSALLVALPATGPLLATAGVLLVGGLAYAATSAARMAPHLRPVDAPSAARTVEDVASPTATSPTAGASPPTRSVPARMVTTALLAVLATGLVMALAFGATDTSLAATARSVLGDDATLGFLFAAIAGGSTVGGLTYGAVAGDRSGRQLLPVTLGVFGAGLAVVAVVLAGPGDPPTPVLLGVLFVVGLAIAPSLIIQQALVDASAPVARTTEAQAWLSTAVTTGGALGTAAAGVVIEHAGVATTFAWAAAALGGAALIALLAQRPWARAAAA